MKTKDNFLEGAQVTKDNQIYGTPNSKSKDGTGDSPNDNIRKNKSEQYRWASSQEFSWLLNLFINFIYIVY